MVLAGTMLFLSDIAYAKSRTQDSVPGYKPDTGYFAKRFIQTLGVKYRPGVSISKSLFQKKCLPHFIIFIALFSGDMTNNDFRKFSI